VSGSSLTLAPAPRSEAAEQVRSEVRAFLAEELAAGSFRTHVDTWLSGVDPAFSRKLGERGKTADAIALYKLNQQYYPSSASIDFALAELYRTTGDRDQAITEYRIVLQKRPNDRRATQRLKELGVGTSH